MIRSSCRSAAVAPKLRPSAYQLGAQLSTLVVLQSTQSGGTFGTLVLRHSVVLVLGYSYSAVLSSTQLKPYRIPDPTACHARKIASAGVCHARSASGEPRNGKVGRRLRSPANCHMTPPSPLAPPLGRAGSHPSLDMFLSFSPKLLRPCPSVRI